MTETPDLQNYSVANADETVQEIDSRYEHFEDEGEVTIFDCENIRAKISSDIAFDLEEVR